MMTMSENQKGELLCLDSKVTETLNILAGFYKNEEMLKVKLLAKNVETGELTELTEENSLPMLFENQVVIKDVKVEGVLAKDLIKQMSREIKSISVNEKYFLIAELNIYIFEKILLFAE